MGILRVFVAAAVVISAVAVPLDGKAPLGKRKYPINDSAIVDLGYSIYQGVPNTTTGVTSWLGSVVLQQVF